eukprot:ctg_278.g108
MNDAQTVSALDGEAECRICREAAGAHRPLLQPCKCAGSIRDVHEACLLRWLQTTGLKSCELCGTRYRFRPLYRPDAPATLSASDVLHGLALLVWRLSRRAARMALAGVVWCVLVPYVTWLAWRSGFATGWQSLVAVFAWRGLAAAALDTLCGCALSVMVVLGFIGLSAVRELLREEAVTVADAPIDLSDDDEYGESLDETVLAANAAMLSTQRLATERIEEEEEPVRHRQHRGAVAGGGHRPDGPDLRPAVQCGGDAGEQLSGHRCGAGDTAQPRPAGAHAALPNAFADPGHLLAQLPSDGCSTVAAAERVALPALDRAHRGDAAAAAAGCLSRLAPLMAHAAPRLLGVDRRGIAVDVLRSFHAPSLPVPVPAAAAAVVAHPVVYRLDRQSDPHPGRGIRALPAGLRLVVECVHGACLGQLADRTLAALACRAAVEHVSALVGGHSVHCRSVAGGVAVPRGAASARAVVSPRPERPGVRPAGGDHRQAAVGARTPRAAVGAHVRVVGVSDGGRAAEPLARLPAGRVPVAERVASAAGCASAGVCEASAAGVGGERRRGAGTSGSGLVGR